MSYSIVRDSIRGNLTGKPLSHHPFNRCSGVFKFEEFVIIIAVKLVAIHPPSRVFKTKLESLIVGFCLYRRNYYDYLFLWCARVLSVNAVFLL